MRIVDRQCLGHSHTWASSVLANQHAWRAKSDITKNIDDDDEDPNEKSGNNASYMAKGSCFLDKRMSYYFCFKKAFTKSLDQK